MGVRIELTKNNKEITKKVFFLFVFVFAGMNHDFVCAKNFAVKTTGEC